MALPVLSGRFQVSPPADLANDVGEGEKGAGRRQKGDWKSDTDGIPVPVVRPRGRPRKYCVRVIVSGGL